MDKAYLVLQNGQIFEGVRFGASGNAIGELVFTTGMGGYVETLTDPSYAGQIVLQTYPLIGNYGVIHADFEGNCAVKGYVVRECCAHPSNFRTDRDLDSFLKEQNVPGICGVDTRQITRILREYGVMNAWICDSPPDDLSALRDYAVTGVMEAVSCKERADYPVENARFHVVLLDYGAKRNIVRELRARQCSVTLLPASATAEDVLALSPDGIMLGNGPGDPAECVFQVEQIRALLGKLPLFGICLGHQLAALAAGGKTYKLKYGHRGANQPVREAYLPEWEAFRRNLEASRRGTDAARAGNGGNLSGGAFPGALRTYITSQNHGYAVDADSVSNGRISFVNANDGTCEGIDYPDLRAFTVQFHPEAHGGPMDTAFLFDRFISLMEENHKGGKL